jgi:hypothetical protein
MQVMPNEREGEFFRMKSWKWLRDLMLEVLIALVAVTGGIIYVARHPKANQHWEIIALTGNTAIIFGFLISWFRHAWKRSVFWMTLAVFLLGHTATYVFVLGRVENWPLAYYVALNPIELALFTPILTKLVARSTDQT